MLATRSRDGRRLSLIVINRDVSHALAARIEWSGFSATGRARVTSLAGADLYDRNDGCTSLSDLRVKPVTREQPTGPTGLMLTLPPASLTSVILTGSRR